MLRTEARVAQGDMGDCLEKFIAGMALGAQRGLSPTQMSRLFMVSECNQRT